MPNVPEVAAHATPSRALALDALRGIAVLMMCLSGVVPRYLPNWMYHGYYPQYVRGAEGQWEPVANPWAFHGHASFTWVDWVFPLFLFAMGAAFPLALSRRLERGEARARIALGILRRGLVLAGFAVYVRQIEAGFIAGGAPGSAGPWWIALLGFVVLFPVFGILPKTWSKRTTTAIRFGGVLTAVGLLAWINARRDQPFSWGYFDIIILLLAYVSVIGSLAWLLTPGRLAPLRALALLFPACVAHELAMSPEWRFVGDGFDGWLPVLQAPKQALDLRWIADTPLLDLSPLYDFTWLKFVWVVIPATWVGDRVLIAMRAPRHEAGDDDRRLRRAAWIATLAIVLVHVGLVRHREPIASWLGGEWSISLGIAGLSLPLVGLAWRATAGVTSPAGALARWSLAFGGIALALGLATEPWEGGIKKGPPATLSWYLVSLGLSVLLLATLVWWAERSRASARLLAPVVRTGQNPMLAYVGIRGLLAPLCALPILAPLTGLFEGLRHDSLDTVMLLDVLGAKDEAGRTIPWLQAVWSFAKTALLALMVSTFTRHRIVWRS